MNMSQQETPEENDRMSFLERVSRYQDGLLNAAEAAELAEEINQNPARREDFVQWQIRSAAIYEIESRESVNHAAPSPPAPVGRSRKSRLAWIGSGLLAMLLAAVILSRWLPSASPLTEQQDNPAALPLAVAQVILAEEVSARFVGEDSPKAGGLLDTRRNYFLVNGLIKLAFPSGATAIIDAPAMFHLQNENCLALEIGSCSVYAPDGAEGFRVMTPAAEVVDRGTRFSVKVHDNSDTEVHVVEGIADLYPMAESNSRLPPTLTVSLDEADDLIRLQDHQAIRIGAFRNEPYESTPFNPQTYRRQLPDRVVRYEATMTEGLSDELVSVTVQRGGELRTYSVEELIPIEVTSFQGETEPERSGHLSGGPERPERPQKWMEDRKLHTGFLNIGGQEQPLDHDPIINEEGADLPAGTPGLGVRFRSPVVNRPGPDLVFFDVQHFLQTLEGDPFHVSPLHFRPGLQTLTVRRYDLTVSSPESLVVLPFWRHKYPQPIRSLAELGTVASQANLRSMPIPVQAIAVGIDLSHLGYAEGEEVEELFFQHALPERVENSQTGIPSRVDPVFIAGFPE